jgi:hypothetical protein
MYMHWRFAILIQVGLAVGLPASVARLQGQDLPIGLPAHPLETSDPTVEVTTPPVPEPVQPSRSDTHIFGLVPEYDTVNDPMLQYKPITSGQKFWIAAHDGFDPFSWVTTGLFAGAAQWHNQSREYGQGAQGYAKRYGASFADGAIANFMSEAILPSLLHDDPRYFRLGRGSFFHRVGYTISREVIARKDSGGQGFNFSEIGGNLGAAALSNLYYPPSERSGGETMERFAVNIVSDTGFNVLKEFWPDMRRKILHK